MKIKKVVFKMKGSMFSTQGEDLMEENDRPGIFFDIQQHGVMFYIDDLKGETHKVMMPWHRIWEVQYG
jgi:hypothetical protein